MKPPGLLWLLLMIGTVSSQVTVPTSGQCQAVCLKEMATKKEFISINGETFLDYDVTNNTDFSLCKLGCHSPDFNELGLPAFRKGQAAYQNIVEKSIDAPLSVSIVSSVSLLCVDAKANSSVFGRLYLHANRSSDHLVHHIEGVRRQTEDGPETIFFASWSYSPLVEFGTNVKEYSAVQFRVTTFDPDGIKGQPAKSEWISTARLLTAGESQILAKPRRTFWKDDEAAAELSFVATQHGIMSCSLALSFSSDDHHEQDILFQLDRSSAFLLERLHFDRTYIVRAESSLSRTDNTVPLSLHVPTCLQLVADSSLCASPKRRDTSLQNDGLVLIESQRKAVSWKVGYMGSSCEMGQPKKVSAPPSVADLHWKWNLSKTEGNTVVLSWVYNSPDQETGRVTGASPRMVHFEVTLTPASPCQFREAQRRIITWTHRSVLLYIPDEKCEYEVDVVVVDAKGRRSPTKRADLKLEEPSVLALTSKWNTEMFILVALLSILLIAAVGMAACRIRDRNSFNTLKREHRQLTKSIVVAHAATLPRNKCVINGNGRPISTTDESDVSGPTGKPRLPQLPAIFYDDEGVYDSLDTPTRSEAAYFDRSSVSSFQRANPIYAGVNVHGLMNLPMERLTVTSCARNPTKPWINASALDRVEAVSFFMKHANEDSVALRQELSILSQISTDHPNLLYFHGIASRESHVIAVLFEPIRGGSLRGYLAEVRATLEGRSPTSSSSGYDGSDRDSLDHKQLDRLTAQLCSFARQCASGLSFVHAQRCIHGGVTPSSVYLTRSWKDALRMPCDQVVKLADFDQAQLDSNPVHFARLPSEHSPPEVLQGKPHTTAGDIWQLGLLLADIVGIGGNPSLFESCAGTVTEKGVKNYYASLTAGHKLDAGLSSLKKSIPRCLSIDPKKRSTARDMEMHLLSLQQQFSDYHTEHVDSVEV